MDNKNKNATRFIAAYNRLDQGLRDIYSIKRTLTFSDMIRKVASVNTLNVYGKIKRQGRTEGLTGNYKKAVVQLSSDSKSIEFFDSLS